MNAPSGFRTAMGFRARLKARQQSAGTLVCVGLDPVEEKIPHVVRAVTASDATAFFLWMRAVVDKTAQFASMFKPNLAHWLAVPCGLEELRNLIAYIRLNYPDIPVFMDCKVGDIDSTQTHYMEAHLGLAQADGMNYNGYMGKSTLVSLVDPKYPGHALVGLGRTSNPAAWVIQDAMMQDGRKLWEFMLDNLLGWSTECGVLEDAGVVMGAAHKDPTDDQKIYSEHLSAARFRVGERMWFLIPGIGTQGGFIAETVKAAYRGPGSIAINSSSGITSVSMESDFAEASATAAANLRDALNEFVS